MRVTVKGEPILLGWCYTTLKKTLMEDEHYAEEFTKDSSTLLLLLSQTPQVNNILKKFKRWTFKCLHIRSWRIMWIAFSILKLMHGKLICPDPGAHALPFHSPLLALTLHFYLTPLCSVLPPPLHTHLISDYIEWGDLQETESGTHASCHRYLSLPFYRHGKKCLFAFS